MWDVIAAVSLFVYRLSLPIITFGADVNTTIYGVEVGTTVMFSVEQYKAALTGAQSKMKKQDFDMLAALYAAPDRSMTAPQLAAAICQPKYQPVNIRYGKLGHLFSDTIQLKPKLRTNGKYCWWRVLSSGKQSKTEKGFLWTMHPQLAQALEELGIVSVTGSALPEEVNPECVYIEGATKQVTVNAYERNKEARDECIAHYGAKCSVCCFDFGQTYGKVGVGYIHVHHLRQLASIGEEYAVDPIKDLLPVCANCHAIVHRRTPPFSVEEVQAMLNKS